MAIYVELHPAGSRVELFDVFDSLAEEEAPRVHTLESWQDVDFLQDVEVLRFGLDREIAAGSAVLVGDVIYVPFGHLPPRISPQSSTEAFLAVNIRCSIRFRSCKYIESQEKPGTCSRFSEVHSI